MSRLWTAEEWCDQLQLTHAEFYRKHPMEQRVQACVALDETGCYTVLECPFLNPEDRLLKLQLLRFAMEKLNAIRYAFYAESWFVQATAANREEMERAAEAKALDTHPDRQEAIFTLVVDPARSAGPYLRRQQIIRGRSGGVRMLKPLPFDENMRFGGVLSTLLPERTYQ